MKFVIFLTAVGLAITVMKLTGWGIKMVITPDDKDD
jgi:hypothetical protein